MNNLSFGKKGEDLAVNFIEQQGLVILKRNFTCKFNKKKFEIDIIAKQNDHLVFIEVKTRKNKSIDLARSSITAKKISNIKKCIFIFLQNNNIKYKYIRIDVIFILNKNIKHFKNVFYI